jgi:hypothetical protein
MNTFPPHLLQEIITSDGLSFMKRIFCPSLSPREMMETVQTLKATKQYHKLILFTRYYLDAGYPIGNLLDHMPVQLVLDIRDFKITK